MSNYLVFFMKISNLLQTAASIVLIVFILWFGKPFLIPLAYAFLISIVLYPMCRFLESKKFGKVFSIVLPLVLLCILFGGLITILSFELIVLSQKWSSIHQQINPLLNSIQVQLENVFGWSAQNQLLWLKENLSGFSQNLGKYLTTSILALFEALLNLIIIPIYISLILFFRGRLVGFLKEIAPKEFKDKLPEILNELVTVFSKFIRGMASVYLIVGILNTIGLWILGVENPILYGLLSAIMTIIPYVGIIISALLPITYSWLETASILQPIGIVGVFAFVQYLEANLIFPYVVGKFININSLVSIITIFLGALIWGVAGMILFLPFLSMFHLFAKHFPKLKPLSKLIES